MTDARALAIIAAFGADPARWPADERAALLAIAGCPEVAAAMREAAQLDGLLGVWARTEVAVPPFDADALVLASRVALGPASRMASAPRRRLWAAGALAAAVAAVLVLTPTSGPQTASTVSLAPVPSATEASEAGDDAAFASVFTPTVDEDALI